jgi:hypothetical protein
MTGAIFNFGSTSVYGGDRSGDRTLFECHAWLVMIPFYMNMITKELCETAVVPFIVEGRM